jgi:hypothetical protein
LHGAAALSGLPNQADFPSTGLKPEQTYRNTFSYRFGLALLGPKREGWTLVKAVEMSDDPRLLK